MKIKTGSSAKHTVDQNLSFGDGCSQAVGTGLLGDAQVKHKAQWLTGGSSVPELSFSTMSCSRLWHKIAKALKNAATLLMAVVQASIFSV